MLFVVDIDGVLAASSSAIVHYLNRLLDLGIPDSVIEAMQESAEPALHSLPMGQRSHRDGPYPVLAFLDWSHLSTLLGEVEGGRNLAASV